MTHSVQDYRRCTPRRPLLMSLHAASSSRSDPPHSGMICPQLREYSSKSAFCVGSILESTNIVPLVLPTWFVIRRHLTPVHKIISDIGFRLTTERHGKQRLATMQGLLSTRCLIVASVTRSITSTNHTSPNTSGHTQPAIKHAILLIRFFSIVK